MSDIQPGDVVVCVDGTPSRCPCHAGYEFPAKQGVLYRVLRVGRQGTKWGLVLAGVTPAPPHNSVIATRFRKIRPAEDEFTELVRKMRPAPAVKAPTDA